MLEEAEAGRLLLLPVALAAVETVRLVVLVMMERQTPEAVAVDRPSTGIGGAGGSGVVIVKVKASNAVNVDKSGWTEVTALMLAAAEKKRELERKAKQAAIVLEKKNEELSGATQMDIEGDLI